MKTILIALLAGTLALAADKAQDVERQLKAAMNTELVDGNLKAAIEQYKKVAQSGVRPLAAQALIHLAECYQKSGDTQARGVYERIVKDFADQKDAVAVARAKLGGGASNAGIITRQMWTGPKVDVYGTVSPDGRSLSFTDWETGDLAVHDFATGQDRRLTNKGTWADSSWQAITSAISRDGKQVAYDWHDGISLFELRLIDLSGANPRVLVPDTPGVEIIPMDWSPDGKWIAARVIRGANQKSQIGLVSTADGTIRVLKPLDDVILGALVFSPDGKYLACDFGANEQREIHLLAVDGGSETPALTQPANDRVLGWSPDGKRLLFASDRSGLTGIWALPIANGRPQGTPEVIKPNVNPVSVGVTRSGALYYSVVSSGRDIYTASVDFETGKLLSAPTPVVQPFLGLSEFPQWSRDGKYLAYLSQRDPNGRSERLPTLVIRSSDTGKIRELNPDMRMLNSGNYSQPLWSPDGGSVLVNALNQQGRRGIYRIDTQSGKATSVILNREAGPVSARALSPDGRTLYLGRIDPKSKMEALIAYDLQSGQEREILRRDSLSWAALSEDGRQLAVAAFDRSSELGSLLLVPVAGGEPRELYHARSAIAPVVSGAETLGGFVAWLPDGKSLLFRKGTAGARETFRISVEGGTPVKYGADWTPAPSSIHPDGRQVAFPMGERQIEIWAMENFLPAPKSSK